MPIAHRGGWTSALGRWAGPLLIVPWLLIAWAVGAADAPPAPDDALGEPGEYPAGLAEWVRPGPFEQLGARAERRGLEVTWLPSPADRPEEVTVLTSTDEPGHWQVRDWREEPMRLTSGAWRAWVPLASIAVPTVYFVRQSGPGGTKVSPMRRFRPREAGLVEPTFPFNGFLDGLEEGIGGWEVVSAIRRGRPLTTSTNAFSGRHCLRVEVPAGRGSIAVGTTRIRGWMLTEHAVAAVRFLARTESGKGRLRVALHSRARTEDLAVHPAGADLEVGSEWRPCEVPLGRFARLQARAVDWFTIEFRAEPGTALLLDDLELVLPSH